MSSTPTPAVSSASRVTRPNPGASASDARSVTNQWCQTWDVKNLFITDGAPFCSNADKNPTLTIMALAWRASDHLIEQMRRKDI